MKMSRRKYLTGLTAALTGCVSRSEPTQEPSIENEITVHADDGYVRVGSDLRVYERAAATTRRAAPVEKDTLDESDFEPIGGRENEIVVMVPIEIHPPPSSPTWVAGRWLLTSPSGRFRPLQEITDDQITYVRASASDALTDSQSRDYRIFPRDPDKSQETGRARRQLCFVVERHDRLVGSGEIVPTLHVDPEITGDCIGCVESPTCIKWTVRFPTPR